MYSRSIMFSSAWSARSCLARHAGLHDRCLAVKAVQRSHAFVLRFHKEAVADSAIQNGTMTLLLSGFVGTGGKPELEHSSAAISIAVFESPVLNFRKSTRDGQPESRRARVGNSPRRAVKRCEESITLGLGDAGASISYAKNDLAVIETARYVDGWVDRRV